MVAAGRSARRAMLALAPFLVVGCAQILGLPGGDGSEPVATAFCKCDDTYREAWPGESCELRFERKLREADEAQVQAFLDLFTEESCADCTNETGRARCASAEPVCAGNDEPCETASVCCKQGKEEVYCGATGRCVSDPANCKVAGEECNPQGLDCCGAVGGNAACTPSGQGQWRCSSERCDPLAPANCPDCCALITYAPPGIEPVLDALCVESGCDFICGAGGDVCGAGKGCVPFFVTDDQNPQKGDLTAQVCFDDCDAGDVAGSACGQGDAAGCCVRWGSTMTVKLQCLPIGPMDDQACAQQFCDPTDVNASCNCEAIDVPDQWAKGFAIGVCP